MAGPLEGIRVVEVGVWVAGPAAGAILADWGADVVKIEPPEGDPARTFQRMLGGDMPSNPPFELDNRNKRSVVLDLGTEDGREAAVALADRADVFLTNVRRPALARMGLDHVRLLERNPRLVYALITGLGTEGPEADAPAYDIAAWWARSGIAASLTPPGAGLPFQRGGMGDHTVAMTAAGMVSAALVARSRTGRGQFVTTSLLRQGAYTIGFDVNTALMWGRSISTGVRTAMGNPCINNYTAGDGRRFWLVGLEGDRHWPPLARAIGHPEWTEDPRFATARDRAANAVALIALLDATFATRPLSEWAAAFAAEPEVFWAPVNTVDDLLADPQFLAAGGIVEVPDGAGTTPMVAVPADFHGTPGGPRSPAPALGQHTGEVLAELKKT
ncbi:MAG TPA: CoA transferase [Acidimicrobiales bacterium]|nr:CoA transferase [Acidimicrobiales bacterium]